MLYLWKNNFTYKSQKLSNGETILEALLRSRYLLRKIEQKLSGSGLLRCSNFILK